MKKQILFVIDSLDCGGAEKSLVSLLQVIDPSRYDIDLLILDHKREKRKGLFEKYVPESTNVLDFHLFGKSLFELIRKFFHYLRLSPQLRLIHSRHGTEVYWRSAHFDYKRLEKHYDVAIAYQQGIPTFYVATKVNADKKIAWINANLYNEGYDMDYCKPFYDKMDKVVAVSSGLVTILSERSPWIKDKLVCIYDIVNPALIKQMAQEPIDDERFSGEEIKLVTVGRLAPPKNHLLAVETARILRDKNVKFKWYFVGDGPIRGSIEKSINEYGLQNHVILLGLKGNPYPYIKNADIYVQTSSHEGFCLTLAEARVLCRPIVSTNFDVVYDQITDHQNGLIAEMTPEKVADCILNLLNDSSLRDSLILNLEKEQNNTSVTEIEKFYTLVEG